MKKIIGLITLVVIGVGGYFGFRYYQDTYVGEVAYAKVPVQVPKRKEHKSKGGIGDTSDWYSYDYEVIFVKQDGTTQKDTFQLSKDNQQPLRPNSYIKVTLSKKRILEGPTTVKESEIPSEVLTELGKVQ